VTLQSRPFSEQEWAPHAWHHVALTWKGGGMVQLFVNGKLAGRASAADLPLSSAMEAADGNRIYIGMPSAGTGGPNGGQGANLEGWVDSVRFDNTVLYDGTGHAVGKPVFTPPAAESWRSLGVFGAPSTAWKSSGGRPPMTRVFDRRTKGYEFTCDFSKVAERCYWDAETKLDLSGAVSLIGWVHVTNAAAIRGINIHFKSGSGWYNVTVPVAEGWNAFAVNMVHFGVQGTPAGFNRIDTARISTWKQQSRAELSKVAFYDVESSMQPARERPFEYPEYDISTVPARPVTRDLATKALLESRMIADEAPYFLLEGGTNAVLDKITQAGFNVYMPCVWHGRGAIYRSGTSILDRQYASKFSGTLDPFAELIEAAHARGIEVHGWFTVALREIDIYPEFAEPGTPARAFDLQTPAFRDFIINEIIEFAKKYNVDGINLDYIRTMGISFSPTASALYLQRFGVGIQELKQSPMSPEVKTRFLAWQRDAVSDVVRRVKEGIRKIKPKLVISISGYPTEKPALHGEGRNEWLWVENGWVDLVYMMGYDSSPDVVQLKNVRRSSPFPERFIMLPGNYGATVNGKVTPREAELVTRHVGYFLRKFPDAGIGVYLYSMLSWEQSVALRDGPFKEGAVPYWGKIKDLSVPNWPQGIAVR
ncbi:MAG: family 10 glycosylhydrolase, partial [Candidatus Manganitrophaceae bacterium]